MSDYSDRGEYLRKQKAGGRTVLGVFPAQYPREILWALGILPVEIWDPPLAPAEAGRHLQPYICSVVRSGMELVLQGKADLVDGFLFPHTCDSIQNMASLINDYIAPHKPCYFFYHPKAPYGPYSREFYYRQVKLLARALEERFGTLKGEHLRESVHAGRKIHAALKDLYDLRAEGRLEASNSHFYRVVRLGEYLLPQDYLAELEGLLSLRRDQATTGGPGVVLSGVLPHPPQLLSMLDDLGVTVVGDDLLALSRRFPCNNLPSEQQDPFATLTDFYFCLPPCSTKGSSLRERLSYLQGLAQKGRAQGIIFCQIKYCETELFDVPFLMEEMKRQGFKVMVFESELHEGLGGQLVTRLEAFVEMLR